MRKLSWFEPGKGASPTEVAEIEARLGHRFPDDYREFLMRYAGSSNPDESEFRVTDSRGDTWGTGVGVLLGVNPAEPDSIVSAYEDLAEQLPDGVVPIIDDGGGDFVCLDYRHGPDPSISYFAHERPPEENIIRLAPNFSAFLDLLTEPEE